MAQVKFLEVTERYRSVTLISRNVTADTWTLADQSPTFSKPAVSGNTRLGLHVTSNELAIWQARMTDNVNTMNGVTFQTLYQTHILADANSFVVQSHPGGDGHWEGYTGSGCVPTNDQDINPGDGGTGFGRGNGAWIMRSAFTFLLTGNNAYGNPVRTELVAQIAEAGTDWSNSSKWCPLGLGGANSLEILPWVNRLLLAYDYLIAGGYTGFSAGEKTSIEQWFTDCADCWLIAHTNSVENNSAYPGMNNTPPNYTCIGDTEITGAPTHQDGWDIRQATRYFQNQAFGHLSLIASVGIMTNNATFKQEAALWFKAFITLGVFDDGACIDFDRWEDCTPNCPSSMWGHAGSVWCGMVTIADVFARAGDTSLYDFSTATQVLGGNGGTVSLHTMGLLAARLANETVTYMTGDGLLPLRPYVVHEGNNGDFYQDWCFMVANLYWQNSEVATAMERAYGFGGGSNSGDCYDPQNAGCFSGGSAFWADLPFMFGKMDGVVDPFDVI